MVNFTKLKYFTFLHFLFFIAIFYIFYFLFFILPHFSKKKYVMFYFNVHSNTQEYCHQRASYDYVHTFIVVLHFWSWQNFRFNSHETNCYRCNSCYIFYPRCGSNIIYPVQDYARSLFWMASTIYTLKWCKIIFHYDLCSYHAGPLVLFAQTTTQGNLVIWCVNAITYHCYCISWICFTIWSNKLLSSNSNHQYVRCLTVGWNWSGS